MQIVEVVRTCIVALVQGHKRVFEHCCNLDILYTHTYNKAELLQI